MPMPKGVKSQRIRGERRTKSVRIHVTAAEHAHVRRLAAAAGQSESAFLYDKLASLFLSVHLPPDPNQPPLPLHTTE